MHVTIDYLALGILLGSLVIFAFLKEFFLSGHFPAPSLAFSKLKHLKISSWRSRLTTFPHKFHWTALICFLIAFIDPHFLFPRSNTHQQALPLREPPTEGIAIYLVLDQSGSMAETVQTTGADGSLELVPKIDLLKQVTKQFILAHPSDLMGLVSFARVPRVLVPLTLDQETLLKHLEQMEVVKQSTTDGTAIGYAIFKTAHLIAATRHFAEDLQGKPPYTIKSAVIVVVTDGFQDPNQLDKGNRLRTIELDDAAAYTKSQGIHLYVINIDPAFASAQFAPHRRQLQTITASTGGHYYLVDDNQALQDIYDSINQLEKGKIFQEIHAKAKQEKTTYTHFSLYPLFISIGLLCLLSALLLDALILKKVP
jgi:Ca-activated chloride channel family protein